MLILLRAKILDMRKEVHNQVKKNSYDVKCKMER